MADSLVNEEELSKLKLSELKKLCKRYSLPTAGAKMELVARLLENKADNPTENQYSSNLRRLCFQTYHHSTQVACSYSAFGSINESSSA
ncbi:unnamed protein product [Dicrocoelium dendriticum]|nr:unnamed protein product [Dicrocoelium dendriticum]